MVDAVLTNHWTTAQELYHNMKINTIDASVRNNIYKILE